MRLKELIEILSKVVYTSNTYTLLYIDKISDWEYNAIINLNSISDIEPIPDFVMESEVIGLEPSIIYDHWRVYGNCGNKSVCYHVTVK